MADEVKTETIEFEKNMGEVVRVYVNEFKGHELVDCRVYYETAEGDWKPTKKGIAMRPELARDVARAILRLAGPGAGCCGGCATRRHEDADDMPPIM